MSEGPVRGVPAAGTPDGRAEPGLDAPSDAEGREGNRRQKLEGPPEGPPAARAPNPRAPPPPSPERRIESQNEADERAPARRVRQEAHGRAGWLRDRAPAATSRRRPGTPLLSHAGLRAGPQFRSQRPPRPRARAVPVTSPPAPPTATALAVAGAGRRRAGFPGPQRSALKSSKDDPTYGFSGNEKPLAEKLLGQSKKGDKLGKWVGNWRRQSEQGCPEVFLKVLLEMTGLSAGGAGETGASVD